MSWRDFADVWDCTPFTGDEPAKKLVHLALAEVVNDIYECRVWFKRSELMAKVGVSRGTVDAAIAQLVKEGWLEVLVAGGGRGRPTEYVYHRPAQAKPRSECAVTETAQPVADTAQPAGITPTTNEKELNLAAASQPPLIPGDSPAQDAPARKPRARDPLWDALTAYFGETTNGAEASRRGKAVRDLKESGATAEQVSAACRTAARWGWEHFTELAIAGNWRRLCADTGTEAEPTMYELQSGRRQR